jgi:uncharacterized protein (DUF1697 family)
MIRYVCFLRGINVGGSKVIKMEVLRGIFESLGFANVLTYIASGNVLFDSRVKNVATLASKIEKGLKEALGHEVNVVLIPFDDLTSIVKLDPFKRIDPNSEAALFVTFISAAPDAKLKLPLISEKENVEVLDIQYRAAFIVARRKKNGTIGFPNAFIEKELGVVGTTRNWSTVKKISLL